MNQYAKAMWEKSVSFFYLFHRKKNLYVSWANTHGILLTEVKKNYQASSVKTFYSKRQSFLKWVIDFTGKYLDQSVIQVWCCKTLEKWFACGCRCRCACKMNRIPTPTHPQDIHFFRVFVVRERVRIVMISFATIKDHDKGLVDQSFRNVKIDAKTGTSFACYFLTLTMSVLIVPQQIAGLYFQ